MRRRCAGQAICVLLAAMLLAGCAPPPPPPQEAEHEKFQQVYYDVFDTVTIIVGYAQSREEFEGHSTVIYDELTRLHKLFDIYHNYDGINNVKTINDNAGIGPVAVDADIIALLTLAREAYDQSGGAVNAAMGSILRLWHDARAAGIGHPETAALPPMDTLEEAARHADIDDVVVDAQAGTVYLRDGAMSLDVGAFAKGYAVQYAMESAKAAGFTSGSINAGGNVCTTGTPRDGRTAWNVGVQSPERSAETAQSLLDVVAVSDMAVVTSGNYERVYLVDGVPYHHIIDPWTYLPATRYKAVTVLHPDSGIAEMLSTPLFILPHEQGLALLEEYGGEAIWVLQDDSVYTTQGYRAVSANFPEHTQ